MIMEFENFFESLKIQFESSASLIIKKDTSFQSLQTWDSLTSFSIVAFVEDDYNVQITLENLKEYNTPLKLFNYINQIKSV